MKKTFTTILFTLAASTAIAADSTTEMLGAPKPMDAVAFSWTGFTVGLQGGYSRNSQDSTIGGLAGLSTDFNGAVGGAFAGFNYQFDNNLVLGIEADIEKNRSKRTSFLAVAASHIDYGLDWQGSVRGRIGYAADRALFYGTAGWAVGSAYASVAGGQEEQENFTGYTFGAGLDYAFTDRVFGHFEYRYTDFGNKAFVFPALGGARLDAEIDQQALRVGLGIKF